MPRGRAAKIVMRIQALLLFIIAITCDYVCGSTSLMYEGYGYKYGGKAVLPADRKVYAVTNGAGFTLVVVQQENRFGTKSDNVSIQVFRKSEGKTLIHVPRNVQESCALRIKQPNGAVASKDVGASHIPNVLEQRRAFSPREWRKYFHFLASGKDEVYAGCELFNVHPDIEFYQAGLYHLEVTVRLFWQEIGDANIHESIFGPFDLKVRVDEQDVVRNSRKVRNHVVLGALGLVLLVALLGLTIMRKRRKLPTDVGDLSP